MIHFKLTFVSGVRSSIKVHFFTYGWPTATKQFLEKTILSSMNWFCTFVKDRMPIFMWSTSGLPIPLHWSIINPILSWLLELDTKSDSSTFVLLLQICFSYSSSLALIYKLQDRLVYIYKISCWDFDWLQWISRSLWRKKVSLLCWVFQSTNSICLSLYLGLLGFLLAPFCSFQYTDPVFYDEFILKYFIWGRGASYYEWYCFSNFCDQLFIACI